MAERPDHVLLRPARPEDLPAIIRMLADDEIGKDRESLSQPLLPAYVEAFEAISADERTSLIVAEATDGKVLGCLQITFIRGLSYQGAERALIEDVRVDSAHRGQKIGHRMLAWAIDEARRRHCRLIELFVHETRISARRFYARLGFRSSHSGMRMQLD